MNPALLSSFRYFLLVHSTACKAWRAWVPAEREEAWALPRTEWPGAVVEDAVETAVAAAAAAAVVVVAAAAVGGVADVHVVA